MVITFSKQVLDRIDEYAMALTEYPITTKRICQKVNNLKSALLSLAKLSSALKTCEYEDLGQTFDINGKAINRYLKRFNYKDKSGFQWAFACLCDYKNNTITIINMMPASQIVKEGLSLYGETLFELWNRMEKLPTHQHIH